MTLPNLAYHVTFKHLLPSIRQQGLVPHVPDDTVFTELKAVFLFKSKEDAKNALYNWLGERIEEMEEEAGFEFEDVLLTVDISGLDCVETTGYEWSCLNVIEPRRILKVESI
jgi:hypothetical protein